MLHALSKESTINTEATTANDIDTSRYALIENQHGQKKHDANTQSKDTASNSYYRSDSSPNATNTTNIFDDKDFDHLLTTTKDSPQPWPAPGLPTSLDPTSGLCCYYPLDVASLFPVLLLDIHPSHHVLDMCSAPGGKALAILQQLDFTSQKPPQTPSLTCNDISSERRIRLQNVIRGYIPPVYQAYIHTFCSDATSPRFAALCKDTTQPFDRILLDAPCSSERHLLLQSQPPSSQAQTQAQRQGQGSAAEILHWAPGRVKGNAERQLALLLNAISMCTVHGKIVYSTCALHDIENDGVIDKMLKRMEKKGEKYGYCIEILSVAHEWQRITNGPIPFGEKTRYGWHILPDRCEGWGPIYVCVLQKIPYAASSSSSGSGGSVTESSSQEVKDIYEFQ